MCVCVCVSYIRYIRSSLRFLLLLVSPPFSLLACHPTLFSLNTPSRHQSISSVAYLLNDYQHTLLHRLSWQSYPSPSSPHGRTTGAHLLQSFHIYPSSPQTPFPRTRDPIHPPKLKFNHFINIETKTSETQIVVVVLFVE